MYTYATLLRASLPGAVGTQPELQNTQSWQTGDKRAISLAWCGSRPAVALNRDDMVGEGLVDEVARHVAALRRDGFTIIEQVIPPRRLEEMKRRVEDAQVAIQEAEAALAPLLKGSWSPDLSAERSPHGRVRHTLAEMGLLPDRETGVGQLRTVEQRTALLDVAAERLAADGIQSVYPPGTPTGANNPGINHIAYCPELAEYLADARVIGVAKALLDIDVRIAQTEIPKSVDITPLRQRDGPLHFGDSVRDRRHWHSDWPHDIGAGSHSGHISQPFPDAVMCLSSVWFFTDVGPENGSKFWVPF